MGRIFLVIEINGKNFFHRVYFDWEIEIVDGIVEIKFTGKGVAVMFVLDGNFGVVGIIGIGGIFGDGLVVVNNIEGRICVCGCNSGCDCTTPCICD